MNKTILLTGAGGVAIPALIKSLKEQGYRVLAADMDPYAVGLFLADKSYVIPGGLAANFLPKLRDICKQEKVDVIVPLVDEELVSACTLEQEGYKVLLPKVDFVRLCLDKYQLMQKIHTLGIPIPETFLLHNWPITKPMIVKPRTGRGSRGVKVVSCQQDLKDYLATQPYSSDQLLLQDYVEGPEYTVSVVVWRSGKVQAVIPKEIISKRGVTKMAVTRRNEKIENLCLMLQEKLRADGPFNVQLKLDSVSGQPLIFEINPRFSTSITLTMAAGVDELGMLANQALFPDQYPEQPVAWKENIVLLRSTQDNFVDYSAFVSSKDLIGNSTP